MSAIDWCPQICPQTPDKPGYMVEMANDVFKHSDFDLEFEYVPWSRAIYRVKVGETDALLSPSKDEAPELRYHSEPLSYQTHCFWTLRNSGWHFDGVENLVRQPFVIYRDHSYASFFASGAVPITSDHYFELIYDERYIPRAIQLLEAKRANAFIFTANSVIFYQKRYGVQSLAIGECIKRDELWFALSPQPSDKIDGIQAHLDDYLAQYKKTERYRALLEKYDIVLPALYNETTAPAFTQQ
ncbi:substrate-binding periplasmic protein [Litoribrevibacter euphylliae]|uniref:Substrate-binding periplasmic protein n=1 Tax=Litoribrevibacter euphylliae TaxID=1834034 RepID=A0ABV7HHC5_9GAMM